jgi:hypothetical protein
MSGAGSKPDVCYPVWSPLSFRNIFDVAVVLREGSQQSEELSALAIGLARHDNVKVHTILVINLIIRDSSVDGHR